MNVPVADVPTTGRVTGVRHKRCFIRCQGLRAAEGDILIKILVAALLLFVPVASAGVSQYAEIAPEPTYECEDEQTYDGEWAWEEGPGYYYSRGWSSSSEWHACESTADLVAAGVASNGHDVAEARVGSYWADSGSSSSYNSGYYLRSDSGNWTHTSYGSSSSNASSAAQSFGNEAVVSIASATVRVADGCESSRFDSFHAQDSGHYSSSDYGYSSSWSSQTGSWSRASDRCGQTATVATGVTNVGAGKERACSAEQYNASWSWSDSYAGESRAFGGSAEECSDGVGAYAGSERVFVGEKTSCREHQSATYGWGSESYQYSHAGGECSKSQGVYGPNGLAVYTTESSWYYEHCQNGECSSDQSSGEGVGVSHDYVGYYVFYLA